MLIHRISFGCTLELRIVQHNLFFSNTLIYALLQDFNQGLFAPTVARKPYFVQKFIMHLLVRCKTILISDLGIAGFIEQALEINELSLGGLNFRNPSFINREYILNHLMYLYKLMLYRNTSNPYLKLGNLTKTA
jgi:hypothetical protein